MRRKFEPFNARIIEKEFFSVPAKDASDLRLAMGNYQGDLHIGYVVQSYGEGLMMIKSRKGTSGRCLFFFSRIVNKVEMLTVVLVYKKESQEVPAHIMATARNRMEGK